MWTRSELKSRAKKNIRQEYAKSILVPFIQNIFGLALAGWLLYAIIADIGVSQTLGVSDYSFFKVLEHTSYYNVIKFLVSVFVVPILVVGANRFFMRLREEKGKVSDILYGFNSKYLHEFIVLFLRNVFVFLWSLLFIIPGIIKSYEYKMVDYILSENPGIDMEAAMKLSKKMMMGEKFNFFVLELSFILWDMLSALTFGLLNIFWIAPYKQATYAEFYAIMREKVLSGDAETKELLPGYED